MQAFSGFRFNNFSRLSFKTSSAQTFAILRFLLQPIYDF